MAPASVGYRYPHLFGELLSFKSHADRGERSVEHINKPYSCRKHLHHYFYRPLTPLGSY